MAVLTEGSETTMPTSSNNNNRRELIINGHQAPSGRYPYFATLNHYCGGALIAPDVILTAGHCVPKHQNEVHPHVGRYSFYENDTAQVVDIRTTDRHPGWKAIGDDEMRLDYGLLFLDGPVDNIPHLRLNRNSSLPVPGEELVAMGVGWTSPDWKTAQKATILQQVHLNYLPNDLCELSSNANSTNEEVNSYEGRIHADHLCTTGGPNNERDACAYDSGSPVIVEGDGPEGDLLVGMVSWGEGCADPDFPAVNARVSYGMDFITKSVCKHSKFPPPEFNCPGSPMISPTVAPNSAPTEAPLPTTNNMGILSSHQKLFLVVCFVLAIIVYWMRRRATTDLSPEDKGYQWIPSIKDCTEKPQTEYQYFSSPASSKASIRSTRSGKSYDAIEIQDV